MSRREATKDMWIGIATIGVAVVYLITMLFEVNSTNDVGGLAGRQMPLLNFSLLVIFGSSLAFSSYRKRSAQPKEAPLSPEEKATALKHWKRAAIYLFLITLYSLAFTYIGFIVSSMFALVVFMVFSGSTNRKGILLTAAIAPLVTWFVFAYLVETPMPDGILF